ncbi:Succinyl-diaminopimelate desuccinylase [Paraconexibacter sp. AEG42_29]|uniref:Succinyl-diaminopimelate desuccinylase n=1 Tax=Paraconexibacter sp. AEG42_29 TaxID=2997339 RepID=A0AAU7B0P2_9ACTN
MDDWLNLHAARIAASARQDLAALVAVSSPSGDSAAADRVIDLVVDRLPDGAVIERPACSTPHHARDLIARISGTGRARIVLVGHVDTVIAHDEHAPLAADPGDPDRLVGSGSVDMKGGDVLALGVLHALAARPDDIAEATLLLVTDEEWRLGEFAHGPRFAGYDACLCFEAGELDAAGDDGVVVRRKAAGTIRVTAAGRSAHSGTSPDDGRNALLALAATAQAIAACHDPHGPDRVTAVPTVMHCGGAFNVVPAAGELICDVRADRLSAFAAVLAAVPAEVGGATLTAQNLRHWPGMDHRESMAPILADAGARLGSPITAGSRGGASDASHFAAVVPLCVDGLGPLGGLAHAPGEYVLASSLERRARVALAVADAVIAAVDAGRGTPAD